MRAFAQKGSWSTTVTVMNSLQEPTVVVTLTKRLTKKERTGLQNMSVPESTPASFRQQIRSYRFNTEDPKKGGYFGKMVIEFGFVTVSELLAFSNNHETLIRNYESAIKRRIADVASMGNKNL
jgi:hypothetical protein